MKLNPYEPPTSTDPKVPLAEDGSTKHATTIEEWCILAMPLAILSGGVAFALTQLLIIVGTNILTPLPEKATTHTTANIDDLWIYAIIGGMIGFYTGLFCLPLMSFVQKRHLLGSTLGSMLTAICTTGLGVLMNKDEAIPFDEIVPASLASAAAAWMVLWFFGYERRIERV